MVDKVIVTPEEVRGFGDILSPKGVADFQLVDSALSLSSGVFTLSYSGGGLVLTVSQTLVAVGNTITISVSLTDDDGDPVEGASVDLYKVTE